MAGKACGSLLVGKGDIWTELLYDASTHRLLGLKYRDRFAGPYANVEIRLSDFQTHAGVLVPMSRTVRINDGKEGPKEALTSLEINGPVPTVFAEAFR